MSQITYYTEEGLKKLRDEIKGMSNPFKKNDDNTGESSSEKFDINDFK